MASTLTINNEATPVLASAPKDEYRDYSAQNVAFDRVSEFYRKSHTNQTYDFVLNQHKKYGGLDKKVMTFWDAFAMLEEIVDESDPDAEFPQIIHAYQTAEACRKRHPGPEYDWFHLAGFIHDLGKILAHPHFGGEPQWAVVGDTFPVGCAFSDRAVYPEFFEANPDFAHPVYSTEYGVYEPHCGLEAVRLSWGHDEYIYQVCVGNQTRLPDEALYVLRFHSFYPWHNAGAYKHLTNEKDEKMLRWVQEFQKCDLYSKSDKEEDMPKPELLKPYYQSLIEKYFPNQNLKW